MHQIKKTIPPKYFYIIAVILGLIGFCFTSFNLIKDYRKTKDYIRVSGTIEDNHYFIGEDLHVVVRYTYKEKEYKSTQRVEFNLNKQEGDKFDLYIDPTNPAVSRNNYIYNLLICGTMLTLLYSVGVIYAFIKVKRQKGNIINGGNI